MHELYILGNDAVDLLPEITKMLLTTEDIPLLPRFTNTRVIERNYPDRQVTIVLYEKKESVLPFVSTVFGFVIILEIIPWRRDALHIIILPAGGLASTRGKPPNPMSSYKKFVSARKRVLDRILEFIFQVCSARGLHAYSPSQIRAMAGEQPFTASWEGF